MYSFKSFKDRVDLVEFLNSEDIARIDVVSINILANGSYILFYYY